ncbi:MAG: 3-phosphoshikimate 1-carboxyvinyltransferase [Opitutales bacterium]|nr:3-phosphoshikimate 1-carboxyvinyltransferase [Opitutales bacterium]
MNYPDPLSVQPFQAPIRGRIRLPGSKSLTNRALVLAALGDAPVTLTGALFSRDTQILCAALDALGFVVRANSDAATIYIEGQGGAIPRPKARLHVGNAGTAARFLTALLSLHPEGEYFLDGDPEMYHRPMAGLLDALVGQGAEVEYAGIAGHFPFTLKTHGLAGGRVALDARASSQMLSALIMVAPFAREPMSLLTEGTRPAFVEMTLQLMERLGVHVDCSRGLSELLVRQGRIVFPSAIFAIEPDLTASSYFLGLVALLGGRLVLEGMPEDSLQGDIAFAELLKKAGLEIRQDGSDWFVSRQQPLSLDGRFDMETFSDTFLTLAALAPALAESMEIEGIGHTRFQETDRIEAMRCELKRLGQRVTAEAASLRIETDLEELKSIARKGVAIDTYKDHRVAMSFGILGSLDLLGDGLPWLRINDPACCGKTFPEFFNQLESLRQNSEA